MRLYCIIDNYAVWAHNLVFTQQSITRYNKIANEKNFAGLEIIMCGICGYIGKKRIDDAVLDAMRDTMTHRGPNDAGTWQVDGDGYFVGLAQRRLSIFDLSELGHQPMHTVDGRISIVFNGEVYNFKELRKELEKDGCNFKSDCDTEVILYSYAKKSLPSFQRAYF